MSRPGDGQLVIDEKAFDLPSLGHRSLSFPYLAMTINHEFYPTEFDALRADKDFFDWWKTNGYTDPRRFPEFKKFNDVGKNHNPYFDFLAGTHADLDRAAAGLIVENYLVKITDVFLRQSKEEVFGMIFLLRQALDVIIPGGNHIGLLDAIVASMRSDSQNGIEGKFRNLGKSVAADFKDAGKLAELSDDHVDHLNRLASTGEGEGHNSPIPSSGHDAAAEERVDADIHARQPRLSFDLGHVIRALPGQLDPLVEKEFAVKLNEAARQELGAEVSRPVAHVSEAFETQTQILTIVHVNTEGDLPAVIDAIGSAEEHNLERGRHAMVAIVLGPNAERSLTAQVENWIAEENAPAAVVQEDELEKEDGQIASTTLFLALASHFTDHASRDLLSDLAEDKTAGKQIVVIGEPKTPYRWSQALLEIMRYLAPIEGKGYLMILINGVLAAATKA